MARWAVQETAQVPPPPPTSAPPDTNTPNSLCLHRPHMHHVPPLVHDMAATHHLRRHALRPRNCAVPVPAARLAVCVAESCSATHTDLVRSSTRRHQRGFHCVIPSSDRMAHGCRCHAACTERWFHEPLCLLHAPSESRSRVPLSTDHEYSSMLSGTSLHDVCCNRWLSVSACSALHGPCFVCLHACHPAAEYR